ncbi:hypothetical protein BVRB_012710 [Beta vulgaris subsp. vulgaris]|uniref:Uncharacterized protein n=1 Tax=Beta vulgaris subsp. vulgaris TaxID=3555 RepID=A0A0J8B5C1_BETVV|nr:hypothetical protein BVRB_012710 [Beta vulgaris subsp. vulgaris]
MTTPLIINVSPFYFDNFLLSASKQTKDDIHNGNKIVQAMCDFIGANGMTSNFRLIYLSCDFRYRLMFRDNNNFIQWINLTPSNHVSFLSTLPESKLVSLYPISTTFEMLGFNLFEYNYQVGVDIEVYYCWEQRLNSSTKILQLRVQQEQTPKRPIGQTTIPCSGYGWYLLGYNVLDDTMRLFNKLEFVSYFNVNFWHSFPETSAATRLRDRFLSGFGIRATNVSTPGKVLHGLQLRMDQYGSPPYNVQLFLGSVLHYNKDFYGKKIMVYYCWTGDCLELDMKIGIN